MPERPPRLDGKVAIVTGAGSRGPGVGNGKADGRGDQKELLGGKGAGLAEMTRIGLPVPGGFTVTTEACSGYNQRKGKWPTGREKQIRLILTKLARSPN